MSAANTKKTTKTAAERKLERENAKLTEQLEVLEQSLDASEAAASARQSELYLRRNGVSEKWTDSAVLAALSEADVENGPFAAQIALIERQINNAYSEAELHEMQGNFDKLPGAVGAARRLREQREQLIGLWMQATGRAGQTGRSRK